MNLSYMTLNPFGIAFQRLKQLEVVVEIEGLGVAAALHPQQPATALPCPPSFPFNAYKSHHTLIVMVGHVLYVVCTCTTYRASTTVSVAMAGLWRRRVETLAAAAPAAATAV